MPWLLCCTILFLGICYLVKAIYPKLLVGCNLLAEYACPEASRRKLRSACENSDLDATPYHMKRLPPTIFPLRQRELEDQNVVNEAVRYCRLTAVSCALILEVYPYIGIF